jgi:hypothetical protein
MLFQDDDEEEKEVTLVRKRKQPSASISQPSEGGPSINEAKEDKAEPALKKNEEKGRRKGMKIPNQRLMWGRNQAPKRLKCTGHSKSPVIVTRSPNPKPLLQQRRTMWSKRINIWRLQKITLLGPRMILNHNHSH